MPTWLIIGIAVEAFSIVAAIALCRAAARGEQPDRDEPSPLIAEINRWRASRERAFNRAGITELQGHHRVGMGIDPTRRRS